MLLFLAAISFGCTNKKPSAGISTAAYYWKTTLDFDTTDQKIAHDIGLKTLYVRCFDVDYSAGFGMAIPLGELSGMRSDDISAYDIVPVVYLTQAVLNNLSERGLDSLAERIWPKIQKHNQSFAQSAVNAAFYKLSDAARDSLYEKYGYNYTDSLAKVYAVNNYPEIQMDCDWSKSTRDKYFGFLKTMKRISGKRLTCTLRLHQFADRDVLPPVDAVMLMAYNVSNIKQSDAPNAIIAPDKINAYLKGGTYPLPLDVALPIFSWAACYRGGQYVGLLRDVWATDVANNETFHSLGDNRYRMTRDTVMGHLFLRTGDELRVDEPSEKVLRETAQTIHSHAGQTSGYRIAFFDWNTTKISNYAPVIKNIVGTSR